MLDRKFPRRALRRISGKYGNLESAVLYLRNEGLITELQAKRLHRRIEKAWDRANKIAFVKARKGLAA